MAEHIKNLLTVMAEEFTTASMQKHIHNASIELEHKDAALASLKQENERLEKKAMDMLHGSFTQCCSYCGFEAPPPNGWEELQKHIEECPEHPLPKLKQSLAAAKQENERLRGKVEAYEPIVAAVESHLQRAMQILKGGGDE